MNKIIIGSLLMMTVPMFPIAGYFILSWLKVPDSIYMFSGTLYGFIAVFQIITYGSLVVNGYKDEKIYHLFHG